MIFVSLGSALEIVEALKCIFIAIKIGNKLSLIKLHNLNCNSIPETGSQLEVSDFFGLAVKANTVCFGRTVNTIYSEIRFMILKFFNVSRFFKNITWELAKHLRFFDSSFKL